MKHLAEWLGFERLLFRPNPQVRITFSSSKKPKKEELAQLTPPIAWIKSLWITKKLFEQLTVASASQAHRPNEDRVELLL